MEPFKPQKLPQEYKMDKELLRLLAESNAKYGEYKSVLNTVEVDSTCFLNSLMLTESFKSTQIEGTQISQDDIYYLKYMKKTDDNLEIQNLKETIEYAYESIINGGKISIYLVNEMHGILLNSVRGSERSPGTIRNTQNWIGPSGVGMDKATFVPPAPEQVIDLINNLYEYMNDAFVDPLLINVAVAHAQFETIHPYRDGNGRLGRALIPIQMAMLDESNPMLYLSEVIEMYKPAYQRALMESRKGNILGFIKFFLQCTIDQCTAYISKLNCIKEIFKEDMKTIEQIHGNSVYKIMPIIMKQIVFTKKEVMEESGVSVNVTSNIINKLVELGILVSDSTVVKKGYRYHRIYDVFVG